MINRENLEKTVYFVRRSIRKFKSEKVSKGQIDLLIDTFLQAPTGVNQMAIDAIVLDSYQHIQTVANFHHSQNALTTAPLLFLLVENDEHVASKNCIPYDVGIAGYQLLLTATELGLGSLYCFCDDKSSKSIQNALSIPGKIHAIIAVGYADEQKEPNSKFIRERIHFNAW